MASPEEQSVDQALAVWRACENGSEIYASALVSRAAAVLEKGGYNQVRFNGDDETWVELVDQGGLVVSAKREARLGMVG